MKIVRNIVNGLALETAIGWSSTLLTADWAATTLELNAVRIHIFGWTRRHTGSSKEVQGVLAFQTG